jgi:hypothetical protein
MPESPIALDNRLVFIAPMRLPDDAPADWTPSVEHLSQAAPPSGDSRALYVTDGAFQALHADDGLLPTRWTLTELPDSIELTGVPGLPGRLGRASIKALEVNRVAASPLVTLAVVMRITEYQQTPGGDLAPPDLDVLRAVADTWRLREPLWPGQELPSARAGATAFSLPALLELLLPDLRPAMEDSRAYTWLYAAVETPLSPADRFALAAIDPPGMSPPPDDALAAFERDRTYRRWAASGTWYGFTHYSACVLYTGGAPTWLGPLMAGVYLDLATWVVAVAAHRHMTTSRLRSALRDPARRDDARAAWHHHLASFEGVRLSEQDQGAQLSRAWLEAIEAERGDLAWLLTAAREV